MKTIFTSTIDTTSSLMNLSVSFVEIDGLCPLTTAVTAGAWGPAALTIANYLKLLKQVAHDTIHPQDSGAWSNLIAFYAFFLAASSSFFSFSITSACHSSMNLNDPLQ